APDGAREGPTLAVGATLASGVCDWTIPDSAGLEDDWPEASGGGGLEQALTTATTAASAIGRRSRLRRGDVGRTFTGVAPSRPGTFRWPGPRSLLSRPNPT